MITEIIPTNNFELFVTTDDGQSGTFDVKPYLQAEAFAPLKNPREFNRVNNGKYFVSWACGADLSIDTIRARWTPTEQNGQK